MFHRLTTTLVVTILALSHVFDAKVDEVLEMRIFNHDIRFSDSEMHAVLRKANLTGHGYKKEITTKVVQKADGGQDYQKMYFFYKEVSCTQILKDEQELNKLLSGRVQRDVESKLKKEIKFRHLDKKGQCIVGLEVHYKIDTKCYANQKAVSKLRNKRSPCEVCQSNCTVIIRKD